jgi:hypothetical protein
MHPLVERLNEDCDANMPVVKKQKTATPLSILPPARKRKSRQGLLLPASRDFFTSFSFLSSD